MSDLITETQAEVARLRDMISTTKALCGDRNVNFIIYEHVINQAEIYEHVINQAEEAIREQDAVSLVRLLPELKGLK